MVKKYMKEVVCSEHCNFIYNVFEVENEKNDLHCDKTSMKEEAVEWTISPRSF